MSNLKVYAKLVNGDAMFYHDKEESCSILIDTFLGDDLRPPPRTLEFQVKTKSGKIVKLVIPNNHTEAVVFIDGDRV